MKRILILFIGLAIFSQPYSVAASSDAVELLINHLVEKQLITEDDAEDLIKEIAELTAEQEKAKKTHSVSAKTPVDLSGYIQQRFVNSQESGVNDTLDARRVRLNLAGEVSRNLDFRLQVDFAGSRSAVTNANTNSTALFSRPTLLDAHIGWKAPGGQKLTVGQFKVPFGLENLTSSTVLDTINRSEVTERLAAGRDIGAQGRDVGIQYSGSVDTAVGGGVQFWLGVFNGSGINVGDDNNRKDLAGRILWRTPVQGLTLAAAHYNGSRGSSSVTRDRSAVEAVYRNGPWTAKAEHIWARDDTVSKSGYFILAVNQFAPRWQGVVRYDNYDPDRSIAGDARSTLTFGLNNFLSKDGLQRVQLNYERKREQGNQIKNDQFLAQYQAGF